MTSCQSCIYLMFYDTSYITDDMSSPSSVVSLNRQHYHHHPTNQKPGFGTETSKPRPHLRRQSSAKSKRKVLFIHQVGTHIVRYIVYSSSQLLVITIYSAMYTSKYMCMGMPFKKTQPCALKFPIPCTKAS